MLYMLLIITILDEGGIAILRSCEQIERGAKVYRRGIQVPSYTAPVPSVHDL